MRLITLVLFNLLALTLAGCGAPLPTYAEVQATAQQTGCWPDPYPTPRPVTVTPVPDRPIGATLPTTTPYPRCAPPPASGPKAPAWSGLLHCARCGRRLWFYVGGRGEDPRSYYCPDRRRGACRAMQFRAERLEAQVADLGDLLGIEVDELSQIITCIWVEEGEIISLAALPRYKRLLERLGYNIKERPPA